MLVTNESENKDSDFSKSKIECLLNDERIHSIYLLTINIWDDEGEKTYTILEEPISIYGWIETDDDMRDSLSDDFDKVLDNITNEDGYGVYLIKVLFDIKVDHDDYRQWNYMEYAEYFIDFYFGTKEKWDKENSNQLIEHDNNGFFDLPF
jgi:hypothetical protein